jgi:PIN domain nuclease of toxin-antitoxin system
MARLLLDTHLLIWASSSPEKLSQEAKAQIVATENQLFFSTVSIWEVSIKSALQKEGFHINAKHLYRGLLRAGYQELCMSADHALATEQLPLLHKDPFDRLLLAQATTEGMMLMSADTQLHAYAHPVMAV